MYPLDVKYVAQEMQASRLAIGVMVGRRYMKVKPGLSKRPDKNKILDDTTKLIRYIVAGASLHQLRYEKRLI
jgi:hypothetical protein